MVLILHCFVNGQFYIMYGRELDNIFCIEKLEMLSNLEGPSMSYNVLLYIHSTEP